MSHGFDIAPDKTMRPAPSEESRRLGNDIRAGKNLEFALPGDVGSQKDIRIACILDDFTFTTFSQVCESLQLTADGWKGEVEGFKPHLLFVEAAWHGKDNSWNRKISVISEELVQLLKWCKDNNVPTVFWNKDDPPHYATFINTAALFDFVLTTDIDLIGDYKKGLGHDRVYLMPFWAEPRLHNPIERFDRVKGFCFAGTYYVKYQERRRDFKTFVDSLSPLGVFDIYDRNEYAGNPNYSYPDEYRKFIRGSLPYDKIDRAYKGYIFGLNMNSIKDSQMMCARRTYELLASNTIVLSNYSRAMRNIFGDLIVTTDDGDVLAQRVQTLMEDGDQRDGLRLEGLRKVLTEHTTEHRLSYMTEKIFNRRFAPEVPEVVIVSKAVTSDEANRVLSNFTQQTHPRKKLLLVTGNGVDISDAPGVTVLTKIDDLRLKVAMSDGGLIGIFDPRDEYGPDYLLDLALGTKYSDADAFTKPRSGNSNEMGQKSIGAYAWCDSVVLRRGLIRPHLIEEGSLMDLLEFPDSEVEARTLSVDRFNYISDAGSGNHPSDPPKVYDPGIKVSDILSLAESIGPGKKRVLTKDEVLVIAPHYPSYDNVYRYIFVHRRLKAYREMGLASEVFRYNKSYVKGFSEFEGVDIITGGANELKDILDQGKVRTVCIHFLNEHIWETLNDKDLDRIIVWVHGAEVQPWHRREFNFENNSQRRKAKLESDQRTRFWISLMADPPKNLHFVFVSRYLFDEVTEDLNIHLDPGTYSIIHNYVDQNKFAYREKGVDMRKRVLSIRPFSSRKYGNDLTVNAIIELSKRPFFNEMEFRIMGEGPMFEDTVGPLRKFSNVILENQSLTEKEYPEMFNDYGIFLCPTRWDSQGVSRDEAMSRGLVAVTNRVAAIPEFVEDDSAILAPAEDHVALANGIERLYLDPGLFQRMSKNGPLVVAKKSGHDRTICEEVKLIDGC